MYNSSEYFKLRNVNNVRLNQNKWQRWTHINRNLAKLSLEAHRKPISNCVSCLINRLKMCELNDNGINERARERKRREKNWADRWIPAQQNICAPKNEKMICIYIILITPQLTIDVHMLCCAVCGAADALCGSMFHVCWLFFFVSARIVVETVKLFRIYIARW